MARLTEDSGLMTGVSDVIAFVSENSRLRLHNCTNDMTWYRGQSNCKWHLTPAVFRNKQFENERIYVKEFERLRPEEFADMSPFSKLVKMQHYGLPTRLLDITSNPLIALYFACSSNPKDDGSFYYFATPTFWEDNWAIKLKANYVFNPVGNLRQLLKMTAEYCPVSQMHLTEADLLHTLTVPAHAVLPNYTNARLRQQQGGFLLFGMSLASPKKSTQADPASESISRFKKLDDEKESLLCPVIRKYRVPSECKANILKELRRFGIDEGTLFPELEHQAKSIVHEILIDHSHY